MSSLSSWNPSIKLELKGRTRHIVFSVLEPRLHITLSNSSHTTPQDTFMHSMTLSQESRHPQDAFICILWHILKVRKQSTSAEIFRTFWTCSTNRDDWVCTYSKSTSAVPSFNLRTDEQTDEIPFRPWCQMTRRDNIEKSRSSVRPMSSYRRMIADPGSCDI